MAVVFLAGWETGSGITETATGTAGTFSVQSSVVRSGSFALRTNPATTAVGNVQARGLAATGAPTNGNATTWFCAFHFRPATLPAANTEEFFVFLNTSGAYKGGLRINSSGNVSVWDAQATPAQIGAATTMALSLNTWYRIEVAIPTGTTANCIVSIFADGGSVALESITRNGTFTTGNTGRVAFGKFTNRNGQSVDFYYDDCWLDDASLPGDFKIIKLVPDANGSTMQWTAGTGASNYTQVNEGSGTTLEDAVAYVQNAASVNQVALFQFPDLSTQGVGASDTIRGINVVELIRENAAATTSYAARVRSSATNSDSTASDLGNTTNTFRFRLLATDPATGAAWGQSAVNAVEAGGIEANAAADRLLTIWLMVAYTPVAAPEYIPDPRRGRMHQLLAA